MPSVPEFLLRKLYIPGSLKTRTDGFEFQLNNTLLPVTMTALGVNTDGNPIALTKLFLQFPGKTEIPAAFVSAISPVTLPLNTPLNLRVISSSGLPRQLIIEAETQEVDHINFRSTPNQRDPSPAFLAAHGRHYTEPPWPGVWRATRIIPSIISRRQPTG